MPRARWSLLALGTLVLCGCTQFGPYRTTTITGAAGSPGVTLNVAECATGQADQRWPSCEPGAAATAGAGPGAYALQHRHYRYREQDGREALGDVHLSFVEFDDQGWFADRTQMEALFLLLRRLEGQDDRHVLLLLYAHGWKHNASPCDNNVLCFSRLLERMDIMERKLSPKPRRVVGVYVGWRGLSVDAGALTNVTFWTRKSTAERVGRGGVMELLLRLEDYRWSRNHGRASDKTQLLLTGHSFGGLVLYSALSHVLTERAVWLRGSGSEARYGGPGADAGERERLAAQTRYETARSFGDLVVLVNPAFEGSLYEPLFHVATNRCYDETQRPVMLIATSETDDATGVAFPAGRTLNTLFERAPTEAENESIKRTVGHNPRYETHFLRSVRSGSAPAPEAGRSGACDCPHLTPTLDFRWWEYLQALRQASTKAETIESETTADGHRLYRDLYGKQVELVGDPKYTPNQPYLVVRTDGGVIADHNAIYNERFIEFLHLFFLQHVVQQRPFATACWRDLRACDPAGRLPCEQSCQLPDGASCSGRTVTEPPPR